MAGIVCVHHPIEFEERDERNSTEAGFYRGITPSKSRSVAKSEFDRPEEAWVRRPKYHNE